MPENGSITAEEGYETVKRALDEMLTNTKNKRATILGKRNEILAPYTKERERLRGELARVTEAISALQKREADATKTLDDDIARLTLDIERVEATINQMAKGLAKQGKVDIAQKIDPTVVPPKPEPRPLAAHETCKGDCYWNGRGAPDVCANRCGDAIGSNPTNQSSQKSVTLPGAGQAVPLRVEPPKLKPKGSQRDKNQVGKAITDFALSVLNEGRWENTATIGKRLQGQGYPAKYCTNYAAKALNQLKWEGVAVCFRKGSTIWWRSAKITNLPPPGGN